MAFIPVPGVAQCELNYIWDGEMVQTVLHYGLDPVPSVQDMTELAIAVRNEWETSIMPLQSNEIALQSVRVFGLDSANAPQVIAAFGLPLTGGVLGDSVPNNCALVLTKRTPLRGRSYRGRIFHPGLAESQVANSYVNTGTVTALISAYSELLSFDLTTISSNMVVVSRFQNGVPLANGIGTVVTSLTANNVVDSQRRRLPGRGT